jgi:hypothetical protein
LDGPRWWWTERTGQRLRRRGRWKDDARLRSAVHFDDFGGVPVGRAGSVDVDVLAGGADHAPDGNVVVFLFFFADLDQAHGCALYVFFRPISVMPRWWKQGKPPEVG